MTRYRKETIEAGPMQTSARSTALVNPEGFARSARKVARMEAAQAHRGPEQRRLTISGIEPGCHWISVVHSSVENQRSVARGPPVWACDLQYIGSLPNMLLNGPDRDLESDRAVFRPEGGPYRRLTSMSKYLRDTIVRSIEAIAKHKEAAIIFAIGIALTLVLRVGLG